MKSPSTTQLKASIPHYNAPVSRLSTVNCFCSSPKQDDVTTSASTTGYPVNTLPLRDLITFYSCLLPQWQQSDLLDNRRNADEPWLRTLDPLKAVPNKHVLRGETEPEVTHRPQSATKAARYSRTLSPCSHSEFFRGAVPAPRARYTWLK